MGERVNSKADHVYGELKEAILSGNLEPGDPIDKLALCERLGVSRFPVSAAVSRLAFEGLVVIEPQHGSFVSRISVEDVRERWFIRRALESEIAAEAARRLTREGREALCENIAREREAVEAGDRQAFYATRRRVPSGVDDASAFEAQRRDPRRRARASRAGPPDAHGAGGAHSPHPERTFGDCRTRSRRATSPAPAPRWIVISPARPNTSKPSRGNDPRCFRPERPSTRT